MVKENLMVNEVSSLLLSLGEQTDHVSLNEKLSSSVLNVLWTILGSKQFSDDKQRLTELRSLLKEPSETFDRTGGILNQIPWLKYCILCLDATVISVSRH